MARRDFRREPRRAQRRGYSRWGASRRDEPRWGDGDLYPRGGYYRDRISMMRILAAAARGYGRWVCRAPETRGLASGLAALYPAGQIAHLMEPDPLLVGSLAGPLGLAAWVGTLKAFGSHKYSATAAATVAAVPGWLAFASHFDILNLPTLVGYTSASALAWSAVTWSDVLRERRARQAAQLRWDALATAAGLEGSRLISEEETRTGQRFRIDVRSTGKRASQLARPGSGLAEDLAAQLGLPAERVRITADAKHAGVIVVLIQLADPWQGQVSHPLISGSLDGFGAPSGRSILDGPFVIGVDPDSGQNLQLTVFDKTGGHHTKVVAATGGGKTTLFNNIIEQATDRCDVLVWAIDLGKGTVPTFWAPALDVGAGIEEEHKALTILSWACAVITERSRVSGGRNHQPSPTAPIIVLLVDELDTLVGYDSPIAHQAKPLVQHIYRRGRSAGVELITAGQRDVVQYTGTKDSKANANNKIALRVNASSEMNNLVQGWEALGMPDMSTYAPGVDGVILLVDKSNRWHAGRTRDLSDLDAVERLAYQRRPIATLEPEIAAKLPGYADRHKTPVGSGASPGARSATGPGKSPALAGNGWGINPADPRAVDRLAHDLVADVEARLQGMPAPPDQPTAIGDLLAAKQAFDHAEANDPSINRTIPVPDSVADPILALLDERGDAGARRDEIANALGRSRSGVSKWLAILRDHGVIVAAGAGKAARFYLPEQAPDDGEDFAASD
ncbi:hypothetical protein [Nonomuraea dietziae]|uniref:hypothetical protein n=1 Tax=Nonomuraea dietziae TaxID=65515 RepID=UPI00342238C4